MGHEGKRGAALLQRPALAIRQVGCATVVPAAGIIGASVRSGTERQPGRIVRPQFVHPLSEARIAGQLDHLKPTQHAFRRLRPTTRTGL